ncbi:unnamed protein product [Arabidopsis arenosa]|uniref:Uncharacterized protein n=1 Tax=Arabidopsis arenosa TaxID=38785 RepID=A0A8S2A520_ARAAE|nr:unnamed protein product [Arabidopsis arenosa]CAE6012218.1 unnamed protein product [Arabidopsis arenosa]
MSSENSGDKFPSLKTRESLLRSATCHLAVDLNLDYERIARMSAGFSESDFTRLVNGAARYALFRRSKETDQPLSEVTTDDFLVRIYLS